MEVRGQIHAPTTLHPQNISQYPQASQPSGQVLDKKNISLLPDNKPRILQPRHNTDYANPALPFQLNDFQNVCSRHSYQMYFMFLMQY